MDQDTNICRLCLKITEKDVSYSPIEKNNVVMQSLNLISPLTIKNLQLTENPVICDLCDNKLKELANFKENIITNEFQIQCSQKKDQNSFLETVSQDFEKICRLCLKTPEDLMSLQKNWKENKTILIKCNLHLNLNIPKPSKICNSCDLTLQNMLKFIADCSENEKQIIAHASKKGHLCNRDLFEIYSSKVKDLEEQSVGEDNNNVLEEQERQSEGSSSKIISKTSRKDKHVDKNIEKEVKVARTYEKSKNKAVAKISSKNVDPARPSSSNLGENLKIKHKTQGKSPGLSFKNNLNTELAGKISLNINGTPKTYARITPKKPQNKQVVACISKFNIVADISLIRQIEPSTSKCRDNETITDKILKKLSISSSIDASPVKNIADITLDIGLGSSTVRESENPDMDKDNITQELIELLEETEEFLLKDGQENGCNSDKQYKNAEELLKVLEDEFDENVSLKDKQVDGKSSAQKRKCEKMQILEIINSENTMKVGPVIEPVLEVKATSIQKRSNLLDEKKSPDLKKSQKVKDLNSKSVSPLVVKTIPVKKSDDTLNIKNTSATNGKSVESSSVQTAQKKHNLRQKTITMSFREMLNMKPSKKKVPESIESHTKEVVEKSNSPEQIKMQEISSKDDKKEAVPQEKGYVKKKLVKGAGKNKGICEKNDISEINKSTNKVQEEEISPEGNKDTEESQVPTKSYLKRKTVKRVSDSMKEYQERKVSPKQAKIMSETEKATINNSQEVKKTTEHEAVKELYNTATISPVQEISVLGKKRRDRKTNLEGEKDVPMKRLRKLSMKKLFEKNEQLNQANKKSDEESKAKPKKTNTNKQTETDEDVILSNTDVSDDSNAASQSPDKSVVVTIIRRKKTKNKAQRDKTWLELTGKKLEKEEVGQEVLNVNDVPKKKRGRPPLPESEKKPKKPKPLYYLCNACPFKTISQNVIIQHQYIHNVVDDVIQYMCGHCGFKSRNKELLNQHKETHLSLELLYKCMFCEFCHKKKMSTMYHTLRHDDKDIANMFYCLVLNQMTDEEHYECFQCEYQNIEESVMPDHVIDHQIEEVKNPVVYKFSCKECSYKTKFEDVFKRHQDQHELKRQTKKVKIKKEVKKEPEEESQNEDRQEVVTVYSCDLCCYLTYNKRSLANHKGLKHTRHAHNLETEQQRPKKPPPNPDEIYCCNECAYTTTKKTHLTRHVVVHKSKENMEFYECPHCIFETKHRRSYTRHMEIRHKVIV